MHGRSSAPKTGRQPATRSLNLPCRSCWPGPREALALKPPSVMDKGQIPPSGDKRDSLSQAPDFWRDTNSPDGRYVRRECQRNPESSQDSNAGNLARVCSSVHTLGLAYYFTGD